MPSDFQIVQASLSDVKQLAPLFDAYRVFYGRSSDVQRAETFLAERIRADEAVVYFCRLTSSGPIVGFTLLYPSFSSVSAGPIYILNDLFVSSEFRKLGIGRRLIEAAHEHAQRTGALRVDLTTAQDNHAAQALYESIGYELDTEFRTYSFGIVSE